MEASGLDCGTILGGLGWIVAPFQRVWERFWEGFRRVLGGIWEGLGVELCWVLHRFGERAKLSGAGFCSALLGFVADVFFLFFAFCCFFAALHNFCWARHGKGISGKLWLSKPRPVKPSPAKFDIF